jgi:hypothetical protein
MTGIASRAVTVYQAEGRGRQYFTKKAAYTAASIARINAACMARHPKALSWNEVQEEERCRYCTRTCDGSRRDRHRSGSHEDYGCAEEVEHSYRYRLVARLARWLRWRDERGGKS